MDGCTIPSEQEAFEIEVRDGIEAVGNLFMAAAAFGAAASLAAAIFTGWALWLIPLAIFESALLAYAGRNPDAIRAADRFGYAIFHVYVRRAAYRATEAV